MNEALVQKIKSRGYWRINFQPLLYREDLLPLSACRDLVEKNSVRLRGWQYPIFPTGNEQDGRLEPENNFYHGWVDWMNMKEFWNMYQSGQFLHYLALREDWFEEDSWNRHLAEKIKPGSAIGTVGIVYQLTEVYEFLSRLAQSSLYDEGVNVTISLNNTKNRMLWIDDPNRIPFRQDYIARAQNIEFSKQYSKDDALQSSRELSLKTTVYFLDRFGWHNPPIETLKRDQENLLGR